MGSLVSYSTSQGIAIHNKKILSRLLHNNISPQLFWLMLCVDGKNSLETKKQTMIR